MSKIVQLKAVVRGRAGKGASRAVRKQGLIPGVVYGDKQLPQLVSLTQRELAPHINTGRFLSSLIDLEIDGKLVRTIPRDIQFEPVRDFILHVDFLRLGKGARIAVQVPVRLLHQETCPGIKKGGALNVVSHQLDLYCSADFIPEFISVDLAGLEIGRSIHLADLQLPEGVSAVGDSSEITIVTITSKMAEKEEAVAAAVAEVPATAQKAPAAAGAAAKGGSAKAEAAAPKKK